METERRYQTGTFTLETREDGGARLVGHAAVFNSFSRDLGGFKEIIRPGAFARALAGNPDVVALFNHDSNFVLGRSTAKTLRLREDERGLRYEVDLPDTTFAQDLAKSIRRGDISGSSFAFRAIKDAWRTENGADVRELHDVDLFDVSPVTNPAYPAADVAARSHNRWKQHRAEADGATRAREIRLRLARLA
jgi:HK97 family phage prohead protease